MTAWDQLHAEAARLAPIHLRDLFAADPTRVAALSYELDDLTLDLSKEKLDGPAMAALLALAREAGVESLRDRMAAGEPVNSTENRAVLH
ncbi:MAG: glucose-6-phosphate isomerase, partial [Pseudomonadota bacterium]